MTLDEVIDSFKNDLKYSDNVRDKSVLLYLEELKALRVEHEKNSKELEIHKRALEMACNSLSDKTACEWGYDEACIACRQRLGTTSCVNFIKNFYLKKAREENDNNYN